MDKVKIKTSYYAKAKELRENGYLVVGISIGTPRFCKLDAQLKELAPTRYMLSPQCSMDEYLRLYDENIKSQTADKIISKLESLAEERGCNKIALCCYEAPDKFCHRHLLSKFLRDNGYDVDEYKKETRVYSLF